MAKQIPSYLKLVSDTNAEAQAAAHEDLAAVAQVATAFAQVTGWRLELDAPEPNGQTNLMWSAPVNPGVGNSPGHIRLISTAEQTGGPAPRVPLDDAWLLAGAVNNLWCELAATRRALCQREAELAAGVPMVVRDDEQAPPLGQRLEAVLRAGAEAVGCDSLALYLLDPATTELKLRASWGLPRKRLAEPARPLRGAIADLEALMGHAVVLSDEQLKDYWKVPEEGYASCVCVPVSSPSLPLGTLWGFCREPREFSDAQTNILEVVAGRLAADLEREVLIDEALVARQQIKRANLDDPSHRDHRPTIAPLVDGWDVAGHAFHAGQVGGTFYDWFALSDGKLADGRLAVLAGDALTHGVTGALTAAALRATARASGDRPVGAQRLLEKANAILWNGSTGNECSGLFHAVLDPKLSSCTFAAAGPLRVLAIAGERATVLAGPNTPLGWQEETRLAETRHDMAAGELLLVYGTSFLADCDEVGLATLDTHLAMTVEANHKLSAHQLAELADETLGMHPGIEAADRVVLVLRRRGR